MPATIVPYFAYKRFADVNYNVLLSYFNERVGCVVVLPADKLSGAVAV